MFSSSECDILAVPTGADELGVCSEAAVRILNMAQYLSVWLPLLVSYSIHTDALALGRIYIGAGSQSKRKLP